MDIKDGRSKYKTGRTQQFATRVTEEFHRKFKMTAASEGVSMTALLERCLDAYLNRKMRKESLIDQYNRAGKAEKKELIDYLANKVNI